MSTNSMFEIDDLHFDITHPRVLAESALQFEQIKRIRLKHYQTALGNTRSPHEIQTFVNQTSRRAWVNPQLAVRRGRATAGQRRRQPRVVVAYNQQNKIEGLAYGAQNASSRRPGLQGIAERAAKLYLPQGIAGRYLWGREVINPEERAGLETVLGALMLQHAYSEQPASWFPYTEEPRLISQLEQWGYYHVRNEKNVLIEEPDYVFGESASPAIVQTWRVDHARDAISRIYELPGAHNAIKAARDTMPT
jgi:hypothetical protein